MVNHDLTSTICALITPPGKGAVGVIRVSGQQTFPVIEKIFKAKNKNLNLLPSHTVCFGNILDENKIVDEVLVTVFRNPRSYTGEDVIEISCHGSPYIQQKILQLIQQQGVTMAKPGEFTMRAFLNGKLDLAQAEAVADIIASENENAHKLAMQQMRGGYSLEIKNLRDQLVQFAALIELELDFGEEDVEFADRTELKTLVQNLKSKIDALLKSFELGNILKNGIPVVIAGKPNVGKSTLLNTLINEERAIVSEIAGTTRDTIEEELNVDGIRFRFIDTAGLRKTTDAIESIGVQRALSKAGEALVVLYLFDPNEVSAGELQLLIDNLKNDIKSESNPAKASANLIIVANKMDNHREEDIKNQYKNFPDLLCISARQKTNIALLKSRLTNLIANSTIDAQESIVSNARHADALNNASSSLKDVLNGLDNKVTSDFVAMDIRNAVNYLGEITGQVTTDDLLDFIFTKFCIGK